LQKFEVSLCGNEIIIDNSSSAEDNMAATVVIAYYNTAVEAEYLHLWYEAQ